MVFNDRTYSVLIVSLSEKFASSIAALLPNYQYYPVKTVSSISAAKRLTLEKAYDMVLINAPLADDMGTGFAINLSESKNTVVLMFLKSDIEEQVSTKVHDYGVYTLIKPNSANIILQTIKFMSVTRERLRLLETKTMTLEDKMNEIRMVNKAKWLLIDNEHMSEDDAHHYIERLAMNLGKTKKAVADAVIQKYS